ncbi:hypothetical protein V6N12_054785 [Hibiscus sabdariffa]|uniref:GAG-pre-integrase domain-containing protein n=1 Tax=Hibiscus sabdariffa TaxID=183260 RepID=A0ABR2D399_9ROSI
MMALKYKEGTSTTDHVSEFQSVINQLLGMDVKFDDEILGLWLFATLPDSWETFRVSLINPAPHGIITLDLAKSGVLNEKVRRRSQGSTSQSEVLVTENKGETEKKMIRVEIKVEASQDRDIRILSVIIVVIDIGASIHVTSRRDFFTSYTPGDFGVLKMGNDGLVSVTGMGDVGLVSNNGTKLILKDVRHAPDIRLNLISAGRLDDEGFCNTFSDGQWKLTKGSLVVARGKKSSNLYLMKASTSRDTVNMTVNDSSTELWHKHLSHMSEKGLNCLAKKNQLSRLKNATLKNCAYCLAGKQRRVSFSSRPPHRKLELLELVHPDDERSKLDAKTRQCIFIGYGLDGEFGYRLYDPVQKKLVRSREVVFIEDQTIDDIDKAEKEDSPDSGDLTDVNPHDIGDFDAPIDDVVTDQQQAPIAPTTVPLRRSSSDRRSSIRYSSDDYVLLTDKEEPECYEELGNVMFIIVYGRNFHPSLVVSDISILQPSRLLW